MLRFSAMSTLFAILLAIAVSFAAATPLHSEPGDSLTIKEADFAEPVERPVAVARGFQKAPRPNIRPEPAVSPELRKLIKEVLAERAAEARKLKAAEQREAIERASGQRASRKKEQRARRLPSEAPVQSSGEDARRAAARAVSGAAQRGATPQQGGEMALTIGAIGLRNSSIESTGEQEALDRGLIHLPQTSRPWERGTARNVYVVGHRMGWPGTKSWKIFYRLDELQRGDRLILKARGKTYRYRVTEKFVVTPWDWWVTKPVRGRDLLTLQTCTGPDFSQRLIVRADRV